MQSITTFGINQLLVRVARAVGIQAQSHPHRPGLVSALAELIFIENHLAGAFPILIKFVLFLLGRLQKETGREIGEAFREPLVVVGGPTHQMTPPLVRHFMRCHFIDEFGESECVAAQQ